MRSAYDAAPLLISEAPPPLAPVVDPPLPPPLKPPILKPHEFTTVQSVPRPPTVIYNVSPGVTEIVDSTIAPFPPLQLISFPPLAPRTSTLIEVTYDGTTNGTAELVNEYSV